MTITVTNLVMGPATLRVAPFGTTEPTDAVAVPAVGWVDVGATDGGITLQMAQTYTPMNVDQTALPVGSRLTAQEYTVTASLAEATLANFRLALNQVAGAGTVLELDGGLSNAEPNYSAVMIDGSGPGGAPRRIIIRRALSNARVDLTYTQDKKTMIPVTFQAYYVSSSIKALKIDDTPGS